MTTDIIASHIPFYASDSVAQQLDRIDAALEAAGFTLEMVPTGRAGMVWPKWSRGGVVFNSAAEALSFPLPVATVRAARRASRSRSI